MDDAWLTTDGLLRWAETEHLVVSRRQLERWRKEDLLPRPRHVALGYAKGSRTEWPPHAPQQLRALISIHATERRLDHVRFALWLAGYATPLPKLKDAIDHLVLAPFRELMTAGHDAEQRVEQSVVNMMASRDRKGLARHLRAHLPNDVAIQELVTMALHMAFGGTAFFAPPDEATTELWIRGLGLDAARRESLAGAPPWLKNDVHVHLSEMELKDLLSYEYLRRQLEQATTDALEHARHDFATFAEGLQSFVRFLEIIDAPPVFGWLFQFVHLSDTKTAAFFILALLIYRAVFGDIPLDTLNAAFATHRPRMQALVELLEVAPALKPYFHPETGNARFAAASLEERNQIQQQMQRLIAANPQWVILLG